jgi:uncharacterized cupin superfamily protein
MKTSNYTLHDSIDPSKAEPFEVGNVQWLRRPGNGDRDILSSGFWFITPEETPGPMQIVGHADETIFIIEGRVRIQPHGQEAVELSAGAMASINKGVPVTWTVLEPTTELFVYS